MLQVNKILSDLKGMSKIMGCHILIVEDDPLQAKLIEALLLQADYTFVSVRDGHEALERLKEEKFNLIISDANMPGGISGFNLVQTLRMDNQLKDIPFILVTGRRNKLDVERAIELGVDDYAVKPIDGTLFLAKLESLLNRESNRFSFVERPARSEAYVNIHFEIDGLSEQAVQFISPFALPYSYKLHIEAEIFSEIGIAPPKLRITSSVPLKTQNAFRIRANFIGLTEAELGLIRKWIFLNEPRKTRIS